MPYRPRSREQELTSVLDSVYEAPHSGDGAGWENALGALSAFAGCQAADLTYLSNDSQQIVRWECSSIDKDVVQRYITDYCTENTVKVHPRVPVALHMPENRFVSDSSRWDARERGRMAYFGDFYNRVGYEEGVMMCLRAGDGQQSRIIWSGHFSASDALHQHENIQRLRQVLPHLRRACDMEEKLARTLRENSLLQEALHHVAEAVAIVDANARLKFANNAALQLLRQARGVFLAAGERLVVSDSQARDNLARALSYCRHPSQWPGRIPPACIPLPRSDALPLTVTVQPVNSTLAQGTGAVALLFFTDPSVLPADHSDILRNTFRLSPAETRLMKALSDGLLLKEFAARENIAYETVRACLRRLMQKTGAHRQSELVRLAHALRRGNAPSPAGDRQQH